MNRTCTFVSDKAGWGRRGPAGTPDVKANLTERGCQGNLDDMEPLTFYGIRELTPGHRWRQLFDATWAGGRRVVVEAAPGPDFWVPLGGETPDHLLAAAREARERIRSPGDEPGSPRRPPPAGPGA